MAEEENNFEIEETENIDLKKEDLVELRFLTIDGIEVGHGSYASSLTVEALKQQLVALWPEGTTRTPKSGNDLNLVYNAKLMESNMMVADCIKTSVYVPEGAITMHVAVLTPAAENDRDKRLEQKRREQCGCNIV